MLFNWTILESIYVIFALLVGAVFGLISGYKFRDMRDGYEHSKFDVKGYKLLEKVINSKIVTWWYSE